jgi:hypothetical protein
MQFNLFSNSGCMLFIQDCLENTANAGKFSDEEVEFVLSGCNIATGICRELVEGMVLSGVKTNETVRRNMSVFILTLPTNQGYLNHLG